MAVLERMPWAAKDSVFKRLAKIAEVRNLTKEERLQYDASLKRYRDTLSVMQGAEDRGLAQGRAEGQRETNIKNATSMKHLGISTDIIHQVTGLTKDEIDKL